MLAVGNTETSEAQKGTLLILSLEAEGQHIFHTVPFVDDRYETVRTALKTFFVPKVNG